MRVLVVGVLVLAACGEEHERFKIPSSAMVPTIQIGDSVAISKSRRDPKRGEIIVFRNPCTPEKDFVKRVVARGGDSVEVRCGRLYINGAAVPQTLVEEPCEYDDVDETGGRWVTQPCSRYTETLDGATYSTLHAPERPDRDRARTSYFDDVDWHDFPELPGPAPIGRLSSRTEKRGPRVPRCPVNTNSAAPVGEIEQLPEPTDPCGPRTHYRVPAGTVFVMGDNRENSSDSRVWGVVPMELIKGTVVKITHVPGRSAPRRSQ